MLIFHGIHQNSIKSGIREWIKLLGFLEKIERRRVTSHHVTSRQQLIPRPQVINIEMCRCVGTCSNRAGIPIERTCGNFK